jgi:ABC-2 type transport system ATP-binding protein
MTSRARQAVSGTMATTSSDNGSQAGWGASELVVRRGKTVALGGVSLCALPGQVTAVVGGDGAGKTTLLRCLAGSLAPDAGTVRRPVKERVGYQPASSGIYPDLTVAENLDFRAQGYGMSRQAARDRAADYLDRAGLTTAADQLAGQLSGGMRQKLAVIAAMLHQPDLLILDEPTTGIDPVSRSGLWWLIASAAADGCAVVLATSYLDDAERCTSVLVLDAGIELASGTPDEIVAAMPGTLREVPVRPGGAPAARSWRRAGRWRVWDPEPDGGRPDGGGLDGGRPGNGGAALIEPDLQDAVTVAALGQMLSGGAS